jgi:hypothetical protein
MSQKRLRAGKAVEETGHSPLSPETPDRTGSPGIPRLLFEGDGSPLLADKASNHKFDLVAGNQREPPGQQETGLPEAYGTGKLLLTARDPHSLFAHWDLTNEQQRHYNSIAADGHLTLRAYAHALSNQPATEVSVEPQSRHLFLNVERAGTSYVAELGYYQPDRMWKTIATSGSTTTPPDAPSTEHAVVFSTPQARRAMQKENRPAKITGPPVIPVTEPPWPFESELSPNEEVAVAGPRRSLPLPDDVPPFVKRGPRKKWTPLQERLLAEMIRISFERREWISSFEIAELVRHEFVLPPHLGQYPLSPEIPSPILPGALINISSPMGEQPGQKGFWFNVNAELIIYGATQPDAQVTIAGRPIELRPDGTFTCHFALPDGDYRLTATAISPQNEQRQAALRFSRHTDYSGEVGVDRPNPSLERLPQPE